MFVDGDIIHILCELLKALNNAIAEETEEDNGDN